MMGEDSVMMEIPPTEEDIKRGLNHGYRAVWRAVDTSVDYVDPYTETPSSQWFSEGNGGEFRKSFHGYP